MKSILTLSLTFLAAAAFAGPGPATFPVRVGSRAEAEKLPAAAPTALACTMCKTVAPIKNRTAFLDLFTAGKTHACPSCKGTVTLKEHSGGKGTHTEYSHTCSMCGPKSAYSCAGHAS